jgi:Fe-S-cluster containining protein
MFLTNTLFRNNKNTKKKSYKQRQAICRSFEGFFIPDKDVLTRYCDYVQNEISLTKMYHSDKDDIARG